MTAPPTPPRPEPVADLMAAWEVAAEAEARAFNAIIAALEDAKQEKAHLTKVATEYQLRIAELEAGLRDIHDAAAAIWGYANDAFQVGDEAEVKALAETIIAACEGQGIKPSWERP